MKNIITLIVLIFITTNANSQIGNTKSKLTQVHRNYTTGIDDDGKEYIHYVVEYGNISRESFCYFTEKEGNEEQLCYKVLIVEPASETNNWIKYFNNNNFVKLEVMIWKDYETSIAYKVEVEEDKCYVIKIYDRKF
jgi:hypothetical protein